MGIVAHFPEETMMHSQSIDSLEWRGMEHAPMDGTNILVAFHEEMARGRGYPVDVMHYEDRPLFGKTWTSAGHDWSCDLDCIVGWISLDDLPELPSLSKV